jgi:hypothetical protein
MLPLVTQRHLIIASLEISPSAGPDTASAFVKARLQTILADYERIARNLTAVSDSNPHSAANADADADALDGQFLRPLLKLTLLHSGSLNHFTAADLLADFASRVANPRDALQKKMHRQSAPLFATASAVAAANPNAWSRDAAAETIDMLLARRLTRGVDGRLGLGTGTDYAAAVAACAAGEANALAVSTDALLGAARRAAQAAIATQVHSQASCVAPDASSNDPDFHPDAAAPSPNEVVIGALEVVKRAVELRQASELAAAERQDEVKRREELAAAQERSDESDESSGGDEATEVLGEPVLSALGADSRSGSDVFTPGPGCALPTLSGDDDLDRFASQAQVLNLGQFSQVAAPAPGIVAFASPATPSDAPVSSTRKPVSGSKRPFSSHLSASDAFGFLR